MIKRIELTDFESHKHTVIEDFSDGLNLIVGDSNSGKSSILRAIKLAAYNMFDAGCVRVGATKCIVKIDTDKGYVKVVRGPKANEWEVCRNGEQPMHFNKVGKNAVPQASEVMGLKLVTLGDVEFPVNVMSQLESHFMLSGVGDKNATGSMRAQIVDEISGLSGFEPLVKEVAADGIRLAREKNELDDRRAELDEKILPDEVLENESKALSTADSELGAYDELVASCTSIEKFIVSFKAISGKLDSARQSLEMLPDVSGIIPVLDKCRVDVESISGMDALISKFGRASVTFDSVSSKLSLLPEVGRVKQLVDRTEVLLRNGERIVEIFNYVLSSKAKVDANNEKLDSLPDTDNVRAELGTDERRLNICLQISEFLNRHSGCVERLEILRGTRLPDADSAIELLCLCEKSLSETEFISRDYSRIANLSKRLETLVGDISTYDAQMDKANAEVESRTKDVKICPLTLKPIGPHCLDNI